MVTELLKDVVNEEILYEGKGLEMLGPVNFELPSEADGDYLSEI